jgi:hypothetical protein
VWIQLAQDRDLWRALFNTVMNLRILVLMCMTSHFRQKRERVISLLVQGNLTYTVVVSLYVIAPDPRETNEAELCVETFNSRAWCSEV